MIKINNGLDSFLDTSGKVLEIAPKLYDDTIHPSAQESGKTLSLIPKTINAALVPLRKWIAYREYNMAETERLLAKKLKDLDPEKIVPPEPYVAVPVIQAISYSMDNDQLRNLYSNLLAKSMNIDTKDTVHPSFVEVIKQLSSFDAEFLKNLFYKKPIQIPKIKVRLQVSSNDNIGIDLISTFLSPEYFKSKSLLNEYSFSLDNLERLKIIEVNDSYYLNEPSMYETIVQSIDKDSLLNLRADLNYVDLIKGSISLTNFGKQFIDSVF